MNQPAPKNSFWKNRLPFVFAGFVLIVYGYGQILRGKLIYTTWYGQDASGYFVIILGAAFVLMAVFPWRLIFSLRNSNQKSPSMTLNEARHLIIKGINYAAYHETDFSLQDSDKNRLYGSERYNSAKPVHEPSPWAEGDFEQKMSMLLAWANVLNRLDPTFADAQKLLEDEDSVIGRVIRGAKNRKPSDVALGTKFGKT
jgi:hypothetical protein